MSRQTFDFNFAALPGIARVNKSAEPEPVQQNPAYSVGAASGDSIPIRARWSPMNLLRVTNAERIAPAKHRDDIWDHNDPDFVARWISAIRLGKSAEISPISPPDGLVDNPRPRVKAFFAAAAGVTSVPERRRLKGWEADRNVPAYPDPNIRTIITWRPHCVNDLRRSDAEMQAMGRQSHALASENFREVQSRVTARRACERAEAGLGAPARVPVAEQALVAQRVIGIRIFQQMPVDRLHDAVGAVRAGAASELADPRPVERKSVVPIVFTKKDRALYAHSNASKSS